jgi:hypothetical protein
MLRMFLVATMLNYTEGEEHEVHLHDYYKSAMDYAGVVDFLVLMFAWFKEFDKYRIALIIGPLQNPASLYCIGQEKGYSNDILLHLEKGHYTLLIPSAENVLDLLDFLAMQCKSLWRRLQVVPRTKQSIGSRRRMAMYN